MNTTTHVFNKPLFIEKRFKHKRHHTVVVLKVRPTKILWLKHDLPQSRSVGCYLTFRIVVSSWDAQLYNPVTPGQKPSENPAVEKYVCSTGFLTPKQQPSWV